MRQALIISILLAAEIMVSGCSYSRTEYHIEAQKDVSITNTTAAEKTSDTDIPIDATVTP